MKFSLATFVAGFGAASAAAASSSSSNPFAPKTTPNNSKTKQMSRLLSSATPIRELEGSYSSSSSSSSYYNQVDLSKYSLHFEKCSTVKHYNVNSKNYDTLTAKRYVIFRLCPNHSCGSCDENYGEYIIDMETYVDTMLQLKYEKQEEYCNTCDTCNTQAAQADNNMGTSYDDQTGQQVNQDDACSDIDLDSCYSECLNIANMEDNGYVDAADYVGCVKVYENQNKGVAYWAGAACNGGGSHIKIGLYTDEDCTIQDESASPELYMKNNNGYNVRLSYHLLKHVSVNGNSNGCVASCADYGNGESYGEAIEACETLYQSAAKCESSHGFGNLASSSLTWSDEKMACDFIQQNQYGVYDDSGEIVVSGGRAVMQKATSTGAQKFFLTFFVWGTVFMSAYVALLYHKIMKGQKSLLGAHIKDGSALA
jgi:hypothetical protein